MPTSSQSLAQDERCRKGIQQGWRLRDPEERKAVEAWLWPWRHDKASAEDGSGRTAGQDHHLSTYF